MSENKVTFGLEKVHIAFENANALSQPAWVTPIHIPGAVRFTPTTVGEQTPFYADNTAYYVVNTNNGYTAELELANVPDAVLAEMLGWYIDSNGMLVEVSDAEPKPFALMGQVHGDKKNRKFIYYKCIASRPSKERTTKNESITPATDVLNLTISPIEIVVNGEAKMVVKGDVELNASNSTAYNNFFNAVTLPASSTVNKSALANAIAVAGTLTEADYVAESWDVLEAALTNATTVNSSATAPQNQVDAAYTHLMNAIAALEVDA